MSEHICAAANSIWNHFSLVAKDCRMSFFPNICPVLKARSSAASVAYKYNITCVKLPCVLYLFKFD